MTMRIAMACLAVLVLLAGGWAAGRATATRPRLRSEHSEPTRSTPPAQVAVTEQGKLFHLPSCPLIHGPIVVQSGFQAIDNGYTACPRCLLAE